MRPILWLILTPVGIQNGFEEHEKVEGFPHFQSPGFQFTPPSILRILIVWNVAERGNGRERFPLEDVTHLATMSIQRYTNTWSNVND